MVGFFKTTPTDNPVVPVSSVLNVGGEPFHAAAVALIDHLQNSSLLNESTSKRLLGRLYQYFPKYVEERPYLTIAERMKHLLSSPRRSELVEAMAYTLRQLTVDELLANPLNLKYRSLFANFNAETSISTLRDPHTRLPESALQALENVLGLPVILSYIEVDKPLRARGINLANNTKALEIHVQDSRFYPQVQHPEAFSHVGQIAVHIKPIELPAEQEGNLKDVVNKIAADNKEVVRAYKQLRDNLLTMHKLGDLTYEEIRALYIDLLPYDSQTPAVIRMLEQSEYPVIAGAKVETVKLFINALASWEVAGLIKKDELFEREHLSESTAFAVK